MSCWRAGVPGRDPLGTSGKACLQKDVSGAVKSAHPQAHKPDQNEEVEHDRKG